MQKKSRRIREDAAAGLLANIDALYALILEDDANLGVHYQLLL